MEKEEFSNNNDKNIINTENKEILNSIELSNSNTITGQIKPLSKNQLKKLKRTEEWESKKLELKQFKKKKEKEKKQKKREENEKSGIQPVQIVKENLLPKKEWEQQFITRQKTAPKIVIDCSFENLMQEKDIVSMAKQLTECYATNRKNEYPFNLIFYDIDTNLLAKLQKNSFENWLGVTYTTRDQFKSIDEYISSLTNTSNNNTNISINNIKDEIVYLTADSENEITELEDNMTYIIGGIVDRNKHKLLTFNKAKELNIKHARLPIGDYLHLKSSKVLTTNHVFAILSYFRNVDKDWKAAFTSIIPKRKQD